MLSTEDSPGWISFTHLAVCFSTFTELLTSVNCAAASWVDGIVHESVCALVRVSCVDSVENHEMPSTCDAISLVVCCCYTVGSKSPLLESFSYIF